MSQPQQQMNSYPWHSVVKVTVRWIDTTTQKPVDPAAPYLVLVDPSGTRTRPTLARVSTGVYTASFSVDVTGVWYYQGVGDGSGQGATEIVPFAVGEQLETQPML